MHRARSRLIVTLLLAMLAFGLVRPPAAAADDAVPGPARVQLVGDSLAHSVEGAFPGDWRVRAQNGRALFESMAILTRATSRSPECVVVALGTNDVGRHRTRLEMLHDIEHAGRILAGVGCVAWTTVKVLGVNPVYGAGWARRARMWNTVVRNHAVGTILDWNAVAVTHPGWFLGDGLHLTATGQTAYANLLRGGVPSA